MHHIGGCQQQQMQQQRQPQVVDRWTCAACGNSNFWHRNRSHGCVVLAANKILCQIRVSERGSGPVSSKVDTRQGAWRKGGGKGSPSKVGVDRGPGPQTPSKVGVPKGYDKAGPNGHNNSASAGSASKGQGRARGKGKGAAKRGQNSPLAWDAGPPRQRGQPQPTAQPPEPDNEPDAIRALARARPDDSRVSALLQELRAAATPSATAATAPKSDAAVLRSAGHTLRKLEKKLARQQQEMEDKQAQLAKIQEDIAALSKSTEALQEKIQQARAQAVQTLARSVADAIANAEGRELSRPGGGLSPHR